MTFLYAWQRCDAAGHCTQITGATKPVYVVTAADVGFRLSAAALARNVAGTSSAASNLTATPVASASALRPTTKTLPVVSGPAAVGASLAVSAGSWNSATPVTLRYV